MFSSFLSSGDLHIKSTLQFLLFPVIQLGICVAVFGHQPRSLVLVRNVVSSCIFYNQDPATIIRLITLGRQRNAQSTVILEMDAYGEFPYLSFVLHN